MKRLNGLLAFCLALLMCFGICSCGDGETASEVDRSADKEITDTVSAESDNSEPGKNNGKFMLSSASPVKVTGRAAELADGIALDHSASSIEFVTDSHEITLVAELNREIFFTVYIDGERIPKRVRFSPSDSVRVIASGLNGKHTVKLVRETENMTGNKFTAKMLIMDGKLYEKPENSKLYIEFVGDSITCGLGALHGFIDASDKETILDSQSADCIDTTTDNPIGEEDATNSYAYLCAENLGADCSLVSYSGIGLVRGWTGISMPEFYQYTSLARSNSEKYDFSSARVPDIVVVNLGTNDECIPNKPTQQEFETGVKNFIKQIRDSYKTPNLKIVWATGMMIDANAAWAKNVIDSMHDKNLYVYSNLTQGRTGHNGHPTLDHHASAADGLSEFIRNEVL